MYAPPQFQAKSYRVAMSVSIAFRCKALVCNRLFPRHLAAMTGMNEREVLGVFNRTANVRKVRESRQNECQVWSERCESANVRNGPKHAFEC
jgi:hypothetical protein